jgi:hypothetical protein
MEVRQGISTDYAKEKWDITLDETDLQRLRHEYGQLFGDPDIIKEPVPTWLAMMLLTLEAERFVLVQAPKFGRDVAAVKEQLRANRESFATAMSTATGLTLDETRKVILPEAPR